MEKYVKSVHFTRKYDMIETEVTTTSKMQMEEICRIQ